jgi:hypothetical protein
MYILLIIGAVAAATGILCNLLLLRWGSKSTLFPYRAIALSWIALCLGFVALAISIAQPLAPFLIPIFFAVLTASKTNFTVALTGYVFAQPKHLASKLATFDQTLGSLAGMCATLIGALSLSTTSPIPMMQSAAAIGFALAVAWWVGITQANRLRELFGKISP